MISENLYQMLHPSTFYNALSRTSIFAGINPEEISTLLEGKPFQVRQYGKNSHLAGSGEECRSLMIVVQGSVRGEMSDFSGKTIKIEDIRAPRPLAAAFLFAAENRFPVDIIANEPATVIVIPRDLLISLLQKNQLILKNYLGTISSRAQFLSNRIRFLTFKTIREKIAHYILANGGKEKDRITLNQTQTELAEFFGVTRPSFARALSEMESEGILRVERSTYTILDKEKLNKLLES